MLTDAGLQEALDNVVSNEVDVKAVLQKVALGEADAGIVYATDVSETTDVRNVVIPEERNVVSSYSIAVVDGAVDPTFARQFVAYVVGPGQAVLADAGFLPP
jgi:molybdate transport system substrate-binding protein